jgi:hypothetical protein
VQKPFDRGGRFAAPGRPLQEDFGIYWLADEIELFCIYIVIEHNLK